MQYIYIYIYTTQDAKSRQLEKNLKVLYFILTSKKHTHHVVPVLMCEKRRAHDLK